jgi:hypothetical protein
VEHHKSQVNNLFEGILAKTHHDIHVFVGGWIWQMVFLVEVPAPLYGGMLVCRACIGNAHSAGERESE